MKKIHSTFSFYILAGVILFLLQGCSPSMGYMQNLPSAGNLSSPDSIEIHQKKKYDLRKNSTQPGYKIKIRDAKTKAPILAKVIVIGTRRNDGFYRGSDFVFPYSNHLKIQLKISARGYFYKDIEVSARRQEGRDSTILLQHLEKDQLIQLDGIHFEPQSNILLQRAFPKLKRLRDFMVTNPTVEIEIQGHVNSRGANSLGAIRLSKKRAMRVKDYLVEHGIAKDRMTTKGFGNSQMIYPKAETQAEEEANRRVQIKIK